MEWIARKAKMCYLPLILFLSGWHGAAKGQPVYSYYSKILNRELRYTPDQRLVMVCFKAPHSQQEIETLAAAHGFRSVFPLADPIFDRAVFEVLNPSLLRERLNNLRMSDKVAAAEPALRGENGGIVYWDPTSVDVQFQAEVNHDAALQLVAEQGSSVVRKPRSSGYYILSIPVRKDAFATIREFNRLPKVRFACPTFMVFSAADGELAQPNDPLFPQQWNLQKIGAEAAWAITEGRHYDNWSGMITPLIIHIDTGVWLADEYDEATLHEDLRQNVYYSEGWDHARDDPYPNGEDVPGSHGTNTAGIVVATKNNSKGIAGVAPQCSLQPEKSFLTYLFASDLADAIRCWEDPNRHFSLQELQNGLLVERSKSFLR